MIYNILYFSKNWQHRHVYGDLSVNLKPLGADDRAIAINTNGDGHEMHWTGQRWLLGVPYEVEEKRQRKRLMKALLETVPGARSIGSFVPGGAPQDHALVGQRGWLHRSDPTFDLVAAQVMDVGHRCLRVWLPEYQCALCVPTGSWQGR